MSSLLQRAFPRRQGTSDASRDPRVGAAINIMEEAVLEGHAV
jgi:hypothetical protein